MRLTNSISSAHRLHLSVWFPHGCAQRLSCCVITCLEGTSGISSGTQLLDSSPDKSQKLVSEKKGHDQPQFPLLTSLLLVSYQPCIFLIHHSAHMLGVLLKSAYVTLREHFHYLGHPPKKEPFLNTCFQVIHCDVQGSKGDFGRRGALVPLCWGALGHPMAEGHELFIATDSFSCSSVGWGKDGTALSRLSAASCCPAQ